MRQHRSPRLMAIALVALLALVPTFFTLGDHAGPDVVGSSSLEPTTFYKSEHRSQGNEEHLHAEVGFESVFCLACLNSLRNQSRLTGETTFVATSGLGDAAPVLLAPAPTPSALSTVSSRAPPRA